MKIGRSIFMLFVSLLFSVGQSAGSDRSQWEAQVAAASTRSERFQQAAQQRHYDAISQQPKVTSGEAIEAAKLDPTLRAGDLIATESGFLSFKGKDDGLMRSESDFVAVDPR